MSANCDVIVIFPISGQFGATGFRTHGLQKLMFSLIVIFNLTQAEKRTKKSLIQL